MKWHSLVHTFKHHLMTISFIAGSLTDLYFLNQVDNFYDDITLLFYAVLGFVSVLFLYAGLAERLGVTVSRWSRDYASFTMQYAFGGLFSGMLIFYGHSGSFWSSWPFLLLFIGAIYGNETLKNRGQQLVFNLLSYFVGLFSFFVLIMPVLTGKMGTGMFLLSGCMALLTIYVLVQILVKIVPNYMRLEMRYIVFLIFGMYVFLNTLYFTNVIPPIPLSLKEISIVHSVTKTPDKQYLISYEPHKIWDINQILWPTFNPADSGVVACFTKIYAPAKITTKIVHVWEYKDKTTGKWTERFRLAYPISGEATDGYRGWTEIETHESGKWRCRVETERGQVLGEKTFTVDASVKPTSLVDRLE